MRKITLGLALTAAALFSLSAAAFAAEDISVRNESPYIARVYLYTLHEALVSSATIPYVTTTRLRSEKNGVTAKLMNVYLYDGMHSKQPVCRLSTMIKPHQHDWQIESLQHVRKDSDCYLRPE